MPEKAAEFPSLNRAGNTENEKRIETRSKNNYEPTPQSGIDEAPTSSKESAIEVYREKNDELPSDKMLEDLVAETTEETNEADQEDARNSEFLSELQKLGLITEEDEIEIETDDEIDSEGKNNDQSSQDETEIGQYSEKERAMITSKWNTPSKLAKKKRNKNKKKLKSEKANKNLFQKQESG